MLDVFEFYTLKDNIFIFQSFCLNCIKEKSKQKNLVTITVTLSGYFKRVEREYFDGENQVISLHFL